MKQEKLSALVDGELQETGLTAAMEELLLPDARARLEVYYRIGEALRVESANADLSADFARKMAASLEAEPPLGIADNMQSQQKSQGARQAEDANEPVENSENALESLKQFAIPGIAAMAAAAVILSPQFMFIIQSNASAAPYTAIAGAGVVAQKLLVG